MMFTDAAFRSTLLAWSSLMMRIALAANCVPGNNAISRVAARARRLGVELRVCMCHLSRGKGFDQSNPRSIRQLAWRIAPLKFRFLFLGGQLLILKPFKFGQRH